MAISRILSPEFLRGDDHLSHPSRRGRTNAHPAVAGHDATIPEDQIWAGYPSSVLSCTAWGFSCLANRFASGELLPRPFTLACAKKRTVVLSKNRRSFFCDTFRQPRLSSGTPPRSAGHAAVWCSDFPPANPESFGVHQRSSAIKRILAQHF